MLESTTAVHHLNRNSSFEQGLRRLLLDMRGSLSRLFDSVDVDSSNALEMARRVKINKNLTWKLSRIVREEDPIAAVALIPGKTGVTKIIESFSTAGAARSIVDEIREIFDRLDQFIALHAGNRETFDIMVDSLEHDNQAQRAEVHRKLAYRGQGAVWGVQTKAQLSMHFVAPNPNPEWLDFAVVSGLIDLRRLRSDAPWAVASVRTFDHDGLEEAILPYEPIDDEGFEDGLPLIREFCTSPRPRLRTTPGPDRSTKFELVAGPVGNTAATTCVTGWIYRGTANRFQNEHDKLGEHFVSLSTPAEVAYHELFVHRSLEFALDPQPFLYSHLPGGPVFPQSGRDRGLLPLHETVTPLGNPPDLYAAGLEFHSSLVEKVVSRLCGAVEDYHGFRLTIRYPPIPTIALLRYPLDTPA
jgi:hypothetical protein